MPVSPRAAIGFRAHSGWAAAVAVAGSMGQPVILDRRRIMIADPAIPGSKQPFHASEKLAVEKAGHTIRTCRESSLLLAAKEVQDLAEHWNAATAAILFASGRALPDLARILKSHALIHTAEGEFFREVLIEASEGCGLRVARIREREIRDLQPRIAALGKTLGPPWTQDEKLASLAAWHALAAIE